MTIPPSGKRTMLVTQTPATAADAMPPMTRCVFFGDSITAGQYVPVEHHWTTLLMARWAARAGAAAPPVAFSVGAVSGSTTRMSLERFPQEVQVVAPHVLTIQFGCNDCNRWQTDGGLPRVSPRAFEANLTEMVARARCFGATEVVLSTNYPTLRTNVFADGTPYSTCLREYNAIVRAVARATSVTLHDVEAGFSSHRARLAELLLPSPDLLHLSIAGHELYADLMQPVLFTALGRAARLASPRPALAACA